MTPEVQKVFHQKTKELDCPTYELDKEFSIRKMVKSFDFYYKDISIANIISMLGHHQRTNASLAAMAAIILKSYFKNITKTTIKNGLENTVWAGRCELMRPNLMLDGAHNEDSIAKLVDVLKKDFSNRNIHILFAGLGRKPFRHKCSKNYRILT